MSFLNPVNEPVLRFSSTDAGAPQINYNSRVAGDVKAVLKACLVTGYGAIGGAGWSIVNEVGNIAEFVSPSTAMSDYRLGIDDTSTSSTTWYYQQQGARVNPRSNTANKSFDGISKTDSRNGWQLFATEQGIILVEFAYSTVVNALTSRLTYWGRIKSALLDDASVNIAFFNIGQNAAISEPKDFYNRVLVDFKVGTYFDVVPFSASPLSGGVADAITGVGVVDITSAIYIGGVGYIVGEQPALLTRFVSDPSAIFGVTEEAVGARPVLKVGLGYRSTAVANYNTRGRVFLIYLDYWEY